MIAAPTPGGSVGSRRVPRRAVPRSAGSAARARARAAAAATPRSSARSDRESRRRQRCDTGERNGVAETPALGNLLFQAPYEAVRHRGRVAARTKRVAPLLVAQLPKPLARPGDVRL